MKTSLRHTRTALLLVLSPFLFAASASSGSAASEQGSSLASHVLSFLTAAEVGTLFPIIGLIVAISATQLLRRRKMAQFRSGSSTGR
jgi:hypothetical protein